MRLLSGVNLFGSIGPTIDFPLFGAGLRQAEVDIAKAQLTQAAENYRATVLRALKEVQDELSSLLWLLEEYNQTTPTAVAARKAADLSLTLYRDGASSHLDVATAPRWMRSVDDRPAHRRLVADIGLMLALGGGWSGGSDRAQCPVLRHIGRREPEGQGRRR